MGFANAVLVIYKDGMRWRTDAASIAQWGRVEDSISAPDVTDVAAVDRIGDEFLAIYAQPVESHVVELTSTAPVLGTDFTIGDTLDAGDYGDIRVVGGLFSLASDGTLTKVPELSTRHQENVKRGQRQLGRLLKRDSGVFGTSAAPLNRGTDIPTGRLNSTTLHTWNWGFADELDNPWDPAVGEGDGGTWGAPFTLEQPGRIYEWEIKARVYDDDAYQLTYDQTLFHLYIDDAPGFSLFIALDALDEEGTQYVPGLGTLKKGQTVRPVCVDNGGHEQGTITVRSTDPV